MERPVELSETPELRAHERTYQAFNQLLRWSMVSLASSLLMLTLWFATDAGFFAALVVGVVVFSLGYLLLLREGPSEPTEL